MTRLTRYNHVLLSAAALLLVLSAFTYHNSVTRAERFERGQKFLSNLNPDEIAKIELAKGEESTVLERTAGGDRFVITSADGYYASNREVNRRAVRVEHSLRECCSVALVDSGAE